MNKPLIQVIESSDETNAENKSDEKTEDIIEFGFHDVNINEDIGEKNLLIKDDVKISNTSHEFGKEDFQFVERSTRRLKSPLHGSASPTDTNGNNMINPMSGNDLHQNKQKGTKDSNEQRRSSAFSHDDASHELITSKLSELFLSLSKLNKQLQHQGINYVDHNSKIGYDEEGDEKIKNKRTKIERIIRKKEELTMNFLKSCDPFSSSNSSLLSSLWKIILEGVLSDVMRIMKNESHNNGKAQKKKSKKRKGISSPEAIIGPHFYIGKSLLEFDESTSNYSIEFFVHMLSFKENDISSKTAKQHHHSGTKTNENKPLAPDTNNGNKRLCMSIMYFLCFYLFHYMEVQDQGGVFNAQTTTVTLLLKRCLRPLYQFHIKKNTRLSKRTNLSVLSKDLALLMIQSFCSIYYTNYIQVSSSDRDESGKEKIINTIWDQIPLFLNIIQSLREITSGSLSKDSTSRKAEEKSTLATSLEFSANDLELESLIWEDFYNIFRESFQYYNGVYTHDNMIPPSSVQAHDHNVEEEKRRKLITVHQLCFHVAGISIPSPSSTTDESTVSIGDMFSLLCTKSNRVVRCLLNQQSRLFFHMHHISIEGGNTYKVIGERLSFLSVKKSDNVLNIHMYANALYYSLNIEFNHDDNKNKDETKETKSAVQRIISRSFTCFLQRNFHIKDNTDNKNQKEVQKCMEYLLRLLSTSSSPQCVRFSTSCLNYLIEMNSDFSVCSSTYSAQSIKTQEEKRLNDLLHLLHHQYAENTTSSSKKSNKNTLKSQPLSPSQQIICVWIAKFILRQNPISLFSYFMRHSLTCIKSQICSVEILHLLSCYHEDCSSSNLPEQILSLLAENVDNQLFHSRFYFHEKDKAVTIQLSRQYLSSTDYDKQEVNSSISYPNSNKVVDMINLLLNNLLRKKSSTQKERQVKQNSANLLEAFLLGGSQSIAKVEIQQEEENKQVRDNESHQSREVTLIPIFDVIVETILDYFCKFEEEIEKQQDQDNQIQSIEAALKTFCGKWKRSFLSCNNVTNSEDYHHHPYNSVMTSIVKLMMSKYTQYQSPLLLFGLLLPNDHNITIGNEDDDETHFCDPICHAIYSLLHLTIERLELIDSYIRQENQYHDYYRYNHAYYSSVSMKYYPVSSSPGSSFYCKPDMSSIFCRLSPLLILRRIPSSTYHQLRHHHRQKYQQLQDLNQRICQVLTFRLGIDMYDIHDYDPNDESIDNGITVFTTDEKRLAAEIAGNGYIPFCISTPPKVQEQLSYELKYCSFFEVACTSSFQKTLDWIYREIKGPQCSPSKENVFSKNTEIRLFRQSRASLYSICHYVSSSGNLFQLSNKEEEDYDNTRNSTMILVTTVSFCLHVLSYDNTNHESDNDENSDWIQLQTGCIDFLSLCLTKWTDLNYSYSFSTDERDTDRKKSTRTHLIEEISSPSAELEQHSKRMAVSSKKVFTDTFSLFLSIVTLKKFPLWWNESEKLYMRRMSSSYNHRKRKNYLRNKCIFIIHHYFDHTKSTTTEINSQRERKRNTLSLSKPTSSIKINNRLCLAILNALTVTSQRLPAVAIVDKSAVNDQTSVDRSKLYLFASVIVPRLVTSYSNKSWVEESKGVESQCLLIAASLQIIFICITRLKSLDFLLTSSGIDAKSQNIGIKHLHQWALYLLRSKNNKKDKEITSKDNSVDNKHQHNKESVQVTVRVSALKLVLAITTVDLLERKTEQLVPSLYLSPREMNETYSTLHSCANLDPDPQVRQLATHLLTAFKA